jgi:hypothetical protein
MLRVTPDFNRARAVLDVEQTLVEEVRRLGGDAPPVIAPVRRGRPAKVQSEPKAEEVAA